MGAFTYLKFRPLTPPLLFFNPKKGEIFPISSICGGLQPCGALFLRITYYVEHFIYTRPNLKNEISL